MKKVYIPIHTRKVLGVSSPKNAETPEKHEKHRKHKKHKKHKR